MKKYSEGKKFDKSINCLLRGGRHASDGLLSYEQVQEINDFWKKDGNTRKGFANLQNHNEEYLYFQYVPKKTQNKKDIVAAHRRSGNKTARRNAKIDIVKELEYYES